MKGENNHKVALSSVLLLWHPSLTVCKNPSTDRGLVSIPDASFEPVVLNSTWKHALRAGHVLRELSRNIKIIVLHSPLNLGKTMLLVFVIYWTKHLPLICISAKISTFDIHSKNLSTYNYSDFCNHLAVHAHFPKLVFLQLSVQLSMCFALWKCGSNAVARLIAMLSIKFAPSSTSIIWVGVSLCACGWCNSKTRSHRCSTRELNCRL